MISCKWCETKMNFKRLTPADFGTAGWECEACEGTTAKKATTNANATKVTAKITTIKSKGITTASATSTTDAKASSWTETDTEWAKTAADVTTSKKKRSGKSKRKNA